MKAWLKVGLAGLCAACDGPVVGTWAVTPATPTSLGIVVDHDCEQNQGGLSGLLADDWTEPNLHVIGLGESPGDRVVVVVERQAEMVLVLSSPGGFGWQITRAAGAGLRKVVFLGPDEVPVSAPVEVERSSAPAVCGVRFPPADTCDTYGLIALAERRTGLALSSFHGCARASGFGLLDADAEPTFSPYDRGPALSLGPDRLEVSYGASTGPLDGVRVGRGITTGRWYWEFELLAAGESGGPAASAEVGLSTRYLRLGALPSEDAFGGCGYARSGLLRCSGREGVAVRPLRAGDRVGIAADLSGGKLYFRVGDEWQGGGDPSSGQGALSFAEAAPGRIEFHPAVVLAPGDRVRAHFRDPLGPVPTGYQHLGDRP